MKKAGGGALLASEAINSKAGQDAISNATSSANRVAKVLSYTIATIVIAGGAWLVYRFLIKPAIDKSQTTGEQRASVKESELVLKEQERLGLFVTPTLNFKGMADAIQSALSGGTEDEEAVYTQMRLLNNDADFEALKVAWAGLDGTRQVCGLWGVGCSNYTLSGAIIGLLNADERAVINKIFSDKGMKARF